MLAGVTPSPRSDPAPNRLRWPDYAGAQAVWWGVGPVAGVDCVVAVWEFDVYGGSFGEVDAAAFAAAAEHAAATRRPLLSFLRSGGTRLQEGVAGLVGLPRATLAAAGLDEAGVAHVAVVDHPTTGGVWVTIASRADLRCAVAGATVGFAGPRVVAAVTGVPPDADSHTAEAAWRAGLVDAVVEPGDMDAWLAAALVAATAVPAVDAAAPAAHRDDARASHADADAGSSDGRAATDIRAAGDSGAAREGSRAADGGLGWAQVLAARAAGRTGGGVALDAMAAHGVEMAGGDPAVRARLGLLAPAPGPAPGVPNGAGPDAPGRSGAQGVVGVAVAAEPGGAPGPAGYRLLARAARLAGKLGLPLILFVDTPGADPSPRAEAGGVAAAIGAAMEAVLRCPSPTVSVVVGEGGSGGALAAACADAVLMTPDSYLTALSPEGAAATLRIPAERTADLGGLRPTDLLRLGFADEVLPSTDPAAIVRGVAATLARLTALDQGVRLSTRRTKWSTALPGQL
ncbi:acetyl-CoA carboxylase subunit alpha/beta [Pseudofrankia asymbiotica]|uniref:acetyl-CoA carboxytransferase n=1 Tax=Pseudofrankia asymbiotica TaxID=1834516 RepID=A0A1V2IGZ8_9ACTN|nr:acetyl-CoA carboxylase subunit alpha/beta [Pseudofrankia asymbiotica]